MCPRCAEAVEVEASLRHLDAGSWKDDPSPGDEGGRGRPSARVWKVGVAAAVVSGIVAAVWFARVPSGGREAPGMVDASDAGSSSGASSSAGRPDRWRPDDEAWSPPTVDPRAVSPRKGVTTMGDEDEWEPYPPAPSGLAPEAARDVARRIAALAAPSGWDAGSVRRRLEEAAGIERILDGAAGDAPESALARGRLYASLGRLEEAFDAYGRALAVEGLRREALIGRAWILTAAHLVAEVEGVAHPRTADAFRRRMADLCGASAAGGAWSPEEGRLCEALQDLARREFERARSKLEGLGRDEGPPWVASEIAALGAAWGDISRPLGRFGPPPEPPRRPGFRGGRGPGGPFEMDRRVCMKLSSFVARRRLRRPVPPVLQEVALPHAAALRVDAHMLAGAGRHQEALERFDLALAASPGDVFARLGRAGALARLGRRQDALRQYGETSRLAESAGYPREVSEEIESMSRRVR